MGLEDLNHNFLTGTLENVIKWARTNSMFPATFGLACCAIEDSCGDITLFLKRAFRYPDKQNFPTLIGGSSGIEGTEDLKVRPRWLHVLW